VLLLLTFLFLLMLGTIIRPTSGSTLDRLVNWVAYFDRRTTHLIYRPRRRAVPRGDRSGETPDDSSTALKSRPSPSPQLDWVDVHEHETLSADKPFRGTYPDSDYARAILQRLVTLGVQVTDDPTNLAIAGTHRVQGWILYALLPDRTLVFDREMVSSARDYARLLYRFAHISGGEWQPEGVRAAFDNYAKRAYVKFLHHGERLTWDFEHYGDWVSPEFDELIAQFADAHLPGAYIQLRTDSQESAVLYLPRGIAPEFRRFLDASLDGRN
jgi:hypothetical protein